jgi:hypothetical protein
MDRIQTDSAYATTPSARSKREAQALVKGRIDFALEFYHHHPYLIGGETHSPFTWPGPNRAGAPPVMSVDVDIAGIKDFLAIYHSLA